jgi:hypothetical protein
MALKHRVKSTIAAHSELMTLKHGVKSTGAVHSEAADLLDASTRFPLPGDGDEWAAGSRNSPNVTDRSAFLDGKMAIYASYNFGTKWHAIHPVKGRNTPGD